MRFVTDHSIYITDLETGVEKNTLLDWHMHPATELNMAPPEPKYTYEDTPGVDGDLDASENAADRVLYQNRQGDWEFYVADRPNVLDNMDEAQTWALIQSDISNFLQGKKFSIRFADDPNYYYVGRLHIQDFDPNKYYQHLVISYNVEPYKYELEEYDSGEITVSGSNSVTAAGSPMPTFPTLTIVSSKFAFHQHDVLTRAEAIYMLYNLSAAVSSSHTHWPVTITKSKFLDVSEDDYYYESVLWAEEYGITSGISPTIFAGGNICTRAQFVTMLYAFNWSGTAPRKISGNIPFTDVKINSYYYNPVKWAFTNGYVVGDGNGHFMPNEPMTREQACAILYKYMDEPPYQSNLEDDYFTDLEGSVTIAPWYYVAIVKLWNEGIIDGYADGTYKPGNYITRGQFVTMLYAAAGKPSVSGLSHPFTDVTSDMYCNAAVTYLYDIGCISGTSETTFSPERVMLRKEMLQVLFNFGNYEARYNPNLDYFDPDGEEDNDDAAASGYEVATDVPVESYYFWAVAWGVINDITTLSAGNMFYPDQKATRAMAAQMLYKLMKILEGWEDDTAAEIDGTRTITTREETECLLEWEQGSVSADGSLNDDDLMTITTQYIPITVGGLGTANKFAFTVSSGYKWMASFFSTQGTLVSSYNRQWRNGTGRKTTIDVPLAATYVRFSIQSASSSSTSDDWTIPEDRWAIGTLDSTTGNPDTTYTSRIYSRVSYQIADVGLTSLKFNVLDANGFDVFYIYFYDQNRRYIERYGGYSPASASETITVSSFPSGAYHARFVLAPHGSPVTAADGEKLIITAESAGDSLYPTDGDVARSRAYRIVETTVTDVGVTDITKYTVDYSDAIKSCHYVGLFDEPMIERAPMEVTLENSKGTKTATIPSGTDIAPEFLVVDGENDFTVKGTGKYRIQFRRGSL